MNDELSEKYDTLMSLFAKTGVLALHQMLSYLRTLSKEDMRSTMHDLELTTLEDLLKEALNLEDYEVCEVLKELIEQNRKSI